MSLDSDMNKARRLLCCETAVGAPSCPRRQEGGMSAQAFFFRFCGARLPCENVARRAAAQ